MKLKRELINDIGRTFGTQVVVMLSALIVNKILSNTLSVGDFGDYNIIKRSTAVITFTILGGLGIALPKYLSSFLVNRDETALGALLRSALLYFFCSAVIISVVIMCCGNKFREYIIGNGTIHLTVIICFYSILSALSTLITTYYRGYSNFKISNLNAVVAGILIVVPVVAIRQLSIENLYLSWGLIYFLVSALFFIIPASSPYKLLRNTNPSYEEVKRELKPLCTYSLPRLTGDIFLFTFSAFPLIYIGAKVGPEEVAYYSVGLTFVTLASPIFSFLGTILLPYVSSHKSGGKDSGEKANQLVDLLAIIYACMSLLIALVLYVGMPFFIRLFFSPDYECISDVARIMVFAIIPQAFYLLYRNPIDATRVFPFNTITIGICLLVLVVAFFECRTLHQFAIAYLSVSFLQGVLCFIIWKKIK